VVLVGFRVPHRIRISIDPYVVSHQWNRVSTIHHDRDAHHRTHLLCLCGLIRQIRQQPPAFWRQRRHMPGHVAQTHQLLFFFFSYNARPRSQGSNEIFMEQKSVREHSPSGRAASPVTHRVLYASYMEMEHQLHGMVLTP
jgi:hypothetical protein